MSTVTGKLSTQTNNQSLSPLLLSDKLRQQLHVLECRLRARMHELQSLCCREAELTGLIPDDTPSELRDQLTLGSCRPTSPAKVGHQTMDQNSATGNTEQMLSRECYPYQSFFSDNNHDKKSARCHPYQQPLTHRRFDEQNRQTSRPKISRSTRIDNQRVNASQHLNSGINQINEMANKSMVLYSPMSLDNNSKSFTVMPVLQKKKCDSNRKNMLDVSTLNYSYSDSILQRLQHTTKLEIENQSEIKSIDNFKVGKYNQGDTTITYDQNHIHSTLKEASAASRNHFGRLQRSDGCLQLSNYNSNQYFKSTTSNNQSNTIYKNQNCELDSRVWNKSLKLNMSYKNKCNNKGCNLFLHNHCNVTNINRIVRDENQNPDHIKNSSKNNLTAEFKNREHMIEHEQNTSKSKSVVQNTKHSVQHTQLVLKPIMLNLRSDTCLDNICATPTLV